MIVVLCKCASYSDGDFSAKKGQAFINVPEDILQRIRKNPRLFDVLNVVDLKKSSKKKKKEETFSSNSEEGEILDGNVS